jgi:transcription elongation factor GreA
MTDQATWLTPSAHRKLVEELEHLTTEGRTEIAERLAEARSHGDIRENADYDAAKNEQGLMEARIRQIQDILDNAEVSEATVDGAAVTVGSVVTVERSDGGEMEVFVANQENKVPGLTLASPSSPLGSALIGAEVGSEVSYEAPGGKFKLKVKSVKPYEG